MGGLPSSGDDFADPAHRLRVGGNHRERAQIVQDVLGGDGLAADARIGEGHVFGNTGVEVVADHQHVEMLVYRVDRVGSGRIGGGRQHVRFAAGADDVRCVAAAGTFGVIGVDGAAFERRQSVLDETGFVQGIGVDCHLHVVAFGDC